MSLSPCWSSYGFLFSPLPSCSSLCFFTSSIMLFFCLPCGSLSFTCVFCRLSAKHRFFNPFCAAYLAAFLAIPCDSTTLWSQSYFHSLLFFILGCRFCVELSLHSHNQWLPAMGMLPRLLMIHLQRSNNLLSDQILLTIKGFVPLTMMRMPWLPMTLPSIIIIRMLHISVTVYLMLNTCTSGHRRHS